MDYLLIIQIPDIRPKDLVLPDSPTEFNRIYVIYHEPYGDRKDTQVWSRTMFSKKNKLNAR